MELIDLEFKNINLNRYHALEGFENQQSIKYDLFLNDAMEEFIKNDSLEKINKTKLKDVKYGEKFQKKDVLLGAEEFLKYNEYFLQQGLEGAMLRWGEESYEPNKRSKYLLKYKKFLEMDCLIIDIIPNKSNPLQGTVVCQIAAGNFKCGMKMSHAEREEILINKADYIGKIANVEYFELTDSGLLRFPVYRGLHIDR